MSNTEVAPGIEFPSLKDYPAAAKLIDPNAEFKEVNIGELKSFEPSATVDVYQFEGKQLQIEIVRVDKILSKFDANGVQLPPGKEILAPILRVETVPVIKGKDKDGKEYVIRASEIFSLKVKDGVLGWSLHEKGSLNKFLKKMRVKHPSELVGKLVLATTRPGKVEGQDFLGFVRA